MASDFAVLSRPKWWKGKLGLEIVMPEVRQQGEKSSWSGKQVEEMIFNCLSNSEYINYQVDKFVGKTKALVIMQKWNSDIELFKGTSKDAKPDWVRPAQVPAWKRYCEYVATEGVPTYHDGLNAKYSVRASRQKTFDEGRRRIESGVNIVM